MMNENNDVFTMEDEPIASVVQDMRKGSKWLWSTSFFTSELV